MIILEYWLFVPNVALDVHFERQDHDIEMPVVIIFECLYLSPKDCVHCA